MHFLRHLCHGPRQVKQSFLLHDSILSFAVKVKNSAQTPISCLCLSSGQGYFKDKSYHLELAALSPYLGTDAAMV